MRSMLKTSGWMTPLYLEVRKHYDFIWFEMQHSTMTYADVEAMIAAGAETGEPGATPFLRRHNIQVLFVLTWPMAVGSRQARLSQ